MCGGYFSFDDTNASFLLDVLPPLVRVRAADPRGRLLAHLSELLVTETGTSAVGRSLVLDHIAQILFVQMLRAHAAQGARPSGWLGALGDDGIGAALRALHADVAHRWTVDELAAVSLVSRSASAAAFRHQVGAAPLDYLIQWRMSLAQDALRRGTRSISELAFATGHESVSAFSTAFRRVVGSSPRRFRHLAQNADEQAARQAGRPVRTRGEDVGACRPVGLDVPARKREATRIRRPVEDELAPGAVGPAEAVA